MRVLAISILFSLALIFSSAAPAGKKSIDQRHTPGLCDRQIPAEIDQRHTPGLCDRKIPAEFAHAIKLHELWLSDSSRGQKAVLRGIDLSRTNLDGLDLRFAEFTGVDFTGACLRRTKLADAYLTGAFLVDAKLQSAKLHGTVLNNVTATRVDMVDVEAPGLIAESSDFSNAKLGGGDFTRARFSRSKFVNSSLYNSVLTNSVLDCADLTNVDGRKATFRGASLRDAALAEADLQGAQLQGSWFAPRSFPSARAIAYAGGLGELLPLDDWGALIELASILDNAGFRAQARTVRASATRNSLLSLVPRTQDSENAQTILIDGCLSREYVAPCLKYGAVWIVAGLTSDYRSNSWLVLKWMGGLFALFFFIYLIAGVWSPMGYSLFLSSPSDTENPWKESDALQVYDPARNGSSSRRIARDLYVAFLAAGAIQLRFLTLGSISAPQIFLGLFSSHTQIQFVGKLRWFALVHSLISFYLITLYLISVVPLPFLTGG